MTVVENIGAMIQVECSINMHVKIIQAIMQTLQKASCFITMLVSLMRLVPGSLVKQLLFLNNIDNSVVHKPLHNRFETFQYSRNIDEGNAPVMGSSNVITGNSVNVK